MCHPPGEDTELAKIRNAPLQAFRAVLWTLYARDCDCNGDGRWVTTVDYARAPFPRVDDPLDTDSTASGPKHSGRLRFPGHNTQKSTRFDCQ
jgi:hypothetical protein